MTKEAKNIIWKTAKIAGVTCVTLGGAALIASGAALKGLTAGAKYLKDSLKKIIGEDTKTEDTIMGASSEEIVESPAAEAVVEDVAIVEGEAENT